MKKNKLRESFDKNEVEAKRIKQSERNEDENPNQEQEDDEITSTLALQHDLNVRISRNPFASRVKQPKRLIVVLENASLETVKVGKTYELLNCDRHKQYIIKHRKDPSQCRPDILHQCLLMLFDSPLNRASLLQVYVHSLQNTLIEINPQTRIPRTFDRFCGLMVQLLHKMSIRAADTGDSSNGGGQKLLKVIKNPVTDYLPVGCPKYLASFHAENVENVRVFAEKHQSDQPIVVVIGAMAKGSVDCDYTDKAVSISNYPLSAAITCSKFCTAFEDKWNIL